MYEYEIPNCTYKPISIYNLARDIARLPETIALVNRLPQQSPQRLSVGWVPYAVLPECNGRNVRWKITSAGNYMT